MTAFGEAPRSQRLPKSLNPEVVALSKQQKELHERIHAESDPERRKQLKSQRNNVLHHIRSILRQEGESFWQSKAEAIDTKRPDAGSYYNAIREMRAMRTGQSPQVVRLADVMEKFDKILTGTCANSINTLNLYSIARHCLKIYVTSPPTAWRKTRFGLRKSAPPSYDSEYQAL